MEGPPALTIRACVGLREFCKEIGQDLPLLGKPRLVLYPISLRSIAHRAIHPDRSGLWMVPRRGRSMSTTTGWAWKYGRSFWAAVRRARVACSRWVYLVSASVRDLLIKKNGRNFSSSHSLNKVALTAISEAAR